MTTTATIRRARGADAPAMAACVHSAYRHYAPRIGKPPGPMLDDYAEVVRRHEAYVAESDGAVVGVLVIVETGGGFLLDNVAVAPEFQGRGLGRRLVEFAESSVRARGGRAIELYTHERMTENIAMYARLGYEETDRRTERGYERVYMRKILDDGL